MGRSQAMRSVVRGNNGKHFNLIRHSFFHEETKLLTGCLVYRVPENAKPPFRFTYGSNGYAPCTLILSHAPKHNMKTSLRPRSDTPIRRRQHEIQTDHRLNNPLRYYGQKN